MAARLPDRSRALDGSRPYPPPQCLGGLQAQRIASVLIPDPIVERVPIYLRSNARNWTITDGMRGRSADASVPGYLRVRARDVSRNDPSMRRAEALLMKRFLLLALLASLRSTLVFMEPPVFPSSPASSGNFTPRDKSSRPRRLRATNSTLAAAIILSMPLISPPGRSSGNSSPQAASPLRPRFPQALFISAVLMATSMPWTPRPAN